MLSWQVDDIGASKSNNKDNSALIKKPDVLEKQNAQNIGQKLRKKIKK